MIYAIAPDSLPHPSRTPDNFHVIFGRTPFGPGPLPPCIGPGLLRGCYLILRHYLHPQCACPRASLFSDFAGFAQDVAAYLLPKDLRSRIMLLRPSGASAKAPQCLEVLCFSRVNQKLAAAMSR